MSWKRKLMEGQQIIIDRYGGKERKDWQVNKPLSKENSKPHRENRTEMDDGRGQER